MHLHCLLNSLGGRKEYEKNCGKRIYFNAVNLRILLFENMIKTQF